MEERFSKIEQLLGVMVENISNARKAISEGFSKVDDNFKEVHRKIDELSGHTSNDFKDVKVELRNIHDEISKIGNVTGYEEVFRNLTAVKGDK
jgi:methyl-accepting chemotaxis protein